MEGTTIKHRIKAQIDNKIVDADICSNDINEYQGDLFEYVGQGIYHSIEDKEIDDKILTHFWIFKQK